MYRTVTAAVSVYNGGKYIERCLASLANQSRKFDRIVIYNDASTDNTAEVLREFKGNHPDVEIEFIDSDINRGPGGGKNYLRTLITTDYFTYIDADDYIAEEYLEHLLAVMETNEALDIVFGGFQKVDINGRVIYKRIFDNVCNALIGAFQNWGNLYSRIFFEKNKICIPEGKVLDDVLTRAVMIGHNPVCEIVKGISDYYYVENVESVSRTYMKTFIPGALELEMGYLQNNKNRISALQKDLYEYYAYKILIWHLLKSGAGAGWKSMRTELRKGFSLFEKIFPDYKINRFIIKKAPKGERLIVKMVVRIMYVSERMNLLEALMWLYANVDLSWLWPCM